MDKWLGKAIDHLVVARAILREEERNNHSFSFAQDIYNLDEIIRHCNHKFYGMKKDEKAERRDE